MIITTTQMCILAITMKVAISTLVYLTMKPTFLQNSFRVLFYTTEASQRLLSSHRIKFLKAFYMTKYIVARDFDKKTF